MCRMIASFGVEDSSKTIDSFLIMARGLSEGTDKEEHGDGWGIIYKENGVSRGFWSALPIWEDDHIEDFRHKEVQLLHARNASVGEVKANNSHPFYTFRQGKEWFFCHNGRVNDEFPRFDGLRGNTDSEQLFHYLLSHKEEGNEMEGIEKAMTNLKKYNAANFLLMDGNHMYVNRAYTRKANQYTLEIFEGDNVFLASSEPFDVPYSGVWTPLSNKELLKVDLEQRKVVDRKYY